MISRLKEPIWLAFEILTVLAFCPLGLFQDNVEFGHKTARCGGGFGFIQSQGGEKDVFVHISAVERAGMSDLKEGQRVRFEVVNERDKLAAADLQIV